VGSLVADRIAKRIGLGRTLLLSAGLGSVEWLIVGLAPISWLFPATALSIMIGGFFMVLWNINQVSLRQAITPPHMLGKMNATMRLIVWGPIPIGALLGGVLGSVIGLHDAILIGGIGGFVALAPVALSPVRSLRAIPTVSFDGDTVTEVEAEASAGG
jgi:MFS family permease